MSTHIYGNEAMRNARGGHHGAGTTPGSSSATIGAVHFSLAAVRPTASRR